MMPPGKKGLHGLLMACSAMAIACAADETQPACALPTQSRETEVETEKAPALRLEAVPISGWSTEELLPEARRGDREAMAALARYWDGQREGELPDTYEDVLGPKPEDAPWYDDASHWAAYWKRRWQECGSYGALAAHLEKKEGAGIVPEDPAWVELAALSAQRVEIDDLRDGLDVACSAMREAGKGPVAAKLRKAVRTGLGQLRNDARKGVREAAVRYEEASRSMPDLHEGAWRLVAEAAKNGDVGAMRSMALVSSETTDWQKMAGERGDLLVTAWDLNTVVYDASTLQFVPAEEIRAQAACRLRERGDQKELIRAAEEIFAAGKKGREQRREAEQYLKRAADQGVGRAMLLLCHHYEGKFGSEPEQAKACAMARAMTLAHYAPGYLKLADYKEKGYGTCARDFADAYVLVERAAQSRMPEALVQWARLLMRGIGTEPDAAKAAQILLAVHARAPKTPRLFFMLGYMYETGTGVPADLGKALKFYTQGAEEGDSRAINNLGLMYEQGLGVAGDKRKAADLFRRAAELGNEDGKANSERMQSGK